MKELTGSNVKTSLNKYQSSWIYLRFTVCLTTLYLLVGLLSFADCAVYDIPKICNGINPVQYQGIDTEGSQIDAEISLGKKLADTHWQLVRIYTTLEVDNHTYAPGYCPIDGYRPAHEMETNGSWLSLAFVYGRDAGYAESFLSIPAQTRFYSLGILHARDAWKANDHQTLRLSVQSQSCWDASNAEQRLSFITHVVNTTLTKVWRRVTKGLWLSGTIYIRSPSNQRLGGTFPHIALLYGYVYKYMKCDNLYIEDGEFYDESLAPNFTLCSRWVELDVVWRQVWQAISYMGLLTTVAFAYFLNITVVWFKSRPSRKDLRKVKKECEADNFPDNMYMPVPVFDTNFLQILSISYICQSSSWRSSKLTYAMGWLVSNSLLAIRVVMVVIDIILLVTGFSSVAGGGDANLGQPYAALQPLFGCFEVEPDIGNSVFLSLSLVAVCVWFCLHFYAESWVAKKKESCTENELVIVEILLESVYRIGMIIFSAPIFLTLMLGTLFFLAGMVTYYPFILLAILAAIKVIVMDVLYITKVNKTLSPDIVACQHAADKASQLLQEEVVMDCAKALGKLSTASLDEQRYISEQMRQFVPHHLLITNGRPNCVVSSAPRIASLRLKTTLLLCAHQHVVEHDTYPMNAQLYKDIYQKLAEVIREQATTFILRALALCSIVLVAILWIETIFTVFSNGNTSITAWTGAILPAILLMVEPLTSALRKKSSGGSTDIRDDYLLTEAKGFIVLLILQKLESDQREQQAPSPPKQTTKPKANAGNGKKKPKSEIRRLLRDIASDSTSLIVD
eukprot:scpid45360/ scgid7428/ 